MRIRFGTRERRYAGAGSSGTPRRSEVGLGAREVLDATLPGTGVMTVYARWHNRLLRNDELTALPASTPLAALFKGPSRALDAVGADGVPQEGEGTRTAEAGSEDDDDTYLEGLVSGDTEPEAEVCADASYPLVFYQLAIPGASLRLVKEPGCTLRFHY